MISRVLIGLIYGYRWFISPYLSPKCRFIPTCSQYAIHSLYHHGLLKGISLIAKRLFRCHPYEKLGGGWGYDPIPKNNSPKKTG